MSSEAILEFEKDEYQEACREMREVLQLEKEVAKRKEDLKATVIELAGGDRVEHNIKVTLRERKGSVDYKTLVSDLNVPEYALEAYRKAVVEYWEVKIY